MATGNKAMTKAYIRKKYDAAYIRYVHCPESEEKKAKVILDKWRKIWLNS